MSPEKTMFKRLKLIRSSLIILLVFLMHGFTFAVDISDEPMDTKVQAAPPNLMFILDNSGSMDWEVMTVEDDGLFQIGSEDHEYIFPDPGDHNYDTSSTNGTILSESDRVYWKSQWSEHNKLYYNPHNIYTPWVSTSTYTFTDANVSTPRSNPISTSDRLALYDNFFTITSPNPEVSVIVDNLDEAPAFKLLPNSSAWDESGSTPEYNGSSKWTDDVGAKAVFTATIPEDGTYEVYAWWNCYSNRDEHAKITVNYDGGSFSGEFNQRSGTGQCGDWIKIGEFDFTTAAPGELVIERHSGSNGSSTVADAVKFKLKVPPPEDVVVKNAHYFTWWDENEDEILDAGELYLVTWKDVTEPPDNILDERLFYRVVDVTDQIESGELEPLEYNENDQANDEVPNAVQAKHLGEDGLPDPNHYKTDAEDLQNFANWYSYYRRRELTAKAAISDSIYSLSWVYAGMYTIHGGSQGARQTVLPIETEEPNVVDTVIVDNAESGFTTTGTWSESSAGDYGQEYNNSSLYSSSGTAKWTPDLQDGMYKVYVWFGWTSSRSDKAVYTIHHAGGDSTIELDHTVRDDAFKWLEIGDFTFDAGNSGYVKVENGNGSYISADAIKFELHSGTTNVDQTEDLLDALYEIDSDNNTPLRNALLNVGRYFDVDDGQDGNLSLTSPYKSEAEGGACQQAFCIMMTDGYYNGDDPSGIENEDSGFGDPYEDTYSKTLADVAMYFYKNDLADSLSNNMPTNIYDNNKTQHMVTYSISFGVHGSIDPLDIDGVDGLDDPSYLDDPYFLNPLTKIPEWPDPEDGDLEKIDDLWHAAVNGRGEFFNADNPEELVNALEEIFENLASRIASGASVSVNGDELNTGTVLYQSTYTSGDWEGDVTAYPIDPVTGAILSEESDIIWRAQEELQKQHWDSDRNIITHNGLKSNAGGATKRFRYDNLTDLQKSAISSDLNVVDYIRGKEITGFRARDYKLGDIVHSAPLLVVGDGIDNDDGGSGPIDEYGWEYDGIDNDKDGKIDDEDDDGGEESEEDGLIFAGGNDGMLHAFNALTGEEIFAYVPHLVFDHLENLADPSYDHQFYVDATPFARTVDFGGGDIKTFVTGGLKKGGKGYYCLDVNKILFQEALNLTELDLVTGGNADEVKVLWEYPALDSLGANFPEDDDLGYSFSDIYIVKTHADTLVHTQPWYAIFGNGYNSTNGKAVLYVLDAITGLLITKIDTETGAPNNGLSTPALIDWDSDGKVDYAYAGDLLGNMWKFDLTDPDPTKWKVAYDTGLPDYDPLPLVTLPNTQAITSAPDVMFHPRIKMEYDKDMNLTTSLMVLFGTGKFLGETDRTDTNIQSLYGIWDSGYPLGTWSPDTGTLSFLDGATLLEQDEEYFPTGDTLLYYNNQQYIRVLTDNKIDQYWYPGSNPTSDGVNNDGDYVDPPTDPPTELIDEPDEALYKYMGWYFDLGSATYNATNILEGERVIKDVMIRDRRLIALTFIPDDSPCTGGGISFVFEMDAGNGGRMDKPTFDINGDGKIDTQDLVTVKIPDPENPGQFIEVPLPPTGIQFDGLLHPPIIVTMPDNLTEMKVFSSSAGTVERLFERAEGGFYYWEEYKP